MKNANTTEQKPPIIQSVQVLIILLILKQELIKYEPTNINIITPNDGNKFFNFKLTLFF